MGLLLTCCLPPPARAPFSFLLLKEEGSLVGSSSWCSSTICWGWRFSILPHIPYFPPTHQVAGGSAVGLPPLPPSLPLPLSWLVSWKGRFGRGYRPMHQWGTTGLMADILAQSLSTSLGLLQFLIH